jgi:hypothetical protein
MHALINNKKLLLNYFDDVYNIHFAKLCIPLFYSSGSIKKGHPDRYYFWDSKANDGKNLLRLPSFQIESMAPTDEAFDPKIFIPIREGLKEGLAENKAREYENGNTADSKGPLTPESTPEREIEIAKPDKHLVDKKRETGPHRKKESAEEPK